MPYWLKIYCLLYELIAEDNMMRSKMVENFCYEGFGFPVDLKHVEMIEIEKEWHPKIDVRKIADAVIEALAYQESKLSGNQVRFIRHLESLVMKLFTKHIQLLISGNKVETYNLHE